MTSSLLSPKTIRFARAAQFGKWQRVLFVCALPFAVMPLAYPTPLHAIDQTKAAASANAHPAKNRQFVSTSSEIRRSEFMAAPFQS